MGDVVGPGDRLGPYVLAAVLGRGGMSAVFEAEDTRLGRRVAIKVPNSPDSPRFAREGRAGARVRHPHIVAVLDVGSGGPTPYLVLELVAGPSLAELLRERGRLELEEALEIAFPIAAALEALHREGIVHRDLKPANVLVGRDLAGRPEPKLADFGVSRITHGDETPLTRDQSVIGTLAYIAPEQIRAPAEAGPPADQWAFAVMLFELLVGEPPFRGATQAETMAAILQAAPTPPSELRRELPQALDTVLFCALDPDPSGRYPDLAAMARALLPFASQRLAQKWAPVFGDRPSPSGRTVDDVFVPLPSKPRWKPVVIGMIVASSVVATYAMARRSRALPPSGSTPAALTSAAPSSTPSVVPAVVPSPAVPTTVVSVASSTPPPPRPAPVAPIVVVSTPIPIASVAPAATSAPTTPVLGANGAPIIE